jgi:hypothetical protein
MLASKLPWSVSVTMSSLLISQVDSEVVVLFCSVGDYVLVLFYIGYKIIPGQR